MIRLQPAGRTWLGVGAVATIAALAVLVRFVTQHGGVQDLRVLYGLAPDPYGLTAPIWKAIATRLGGAGIDPRYIGVLGLILCAATVGSVATRLTGERAWITGSAAAFVVGVSGFALPILDSMLGIEASVSLALLLLLAFDQLGVLRLALPWRCALIFCAIVQTPILAIPCALFTLFHAVRGPSLDRILMTVALIAGLGARVLQSGPSFGFHFDEQSTSTAAIGIACILFLLAPLAVLTIKGLGARSWPIGRPGLRAMLLMLGATLSAPFAGFTDLCIAWLGMLAIAFVAALTITSPLKQPTIRRSTLSVAVLLIAVGYIIENALGIGGAQAAISDQGLLKTLLSKSDTGDFNRACMKLNGVSDALLGDGAMTFTHLYASQPPSLRAIDHAIGECAFGSNGEFHTTLLQAGRFGSLPAAAIALSLAAASYQRDPARMPIDAGSVTPRTNIALRGHGAFEEDYSTIMGSVPSITAIGGFGYTIQCTVPNPTTLAFAAANPLGSVPHAAPVRFAVVISSGPGQYVAIERTLEPTPRRNSPQWQYYSVSLPRTLACRTITFRSSVPTSSAIAAWTTFVAPVLK